MIKLAQYKIKWLARLMLGLALFTQGVVAANACIAPNASPVQAYSIGQNADEATPCHDVEIPNANACLAHCDQADQVSLDQHNATVAAPVSVLTWLAPFPQIQHDHPAVTPGHVVLDTGPPIPIRFCSFLN